MQKNLFSDVKSNIVVPIEDGSYTGIITDIERDNKEYDYTRYKVTFKHNDKDVTLSVSYPTTVNFLSDGTPSTQHSKFLNRFGFDNGKDIVSDFIPTLLERKVKFLITQEKNKNGEFSVIVKDSIKPN